MVESTTKKMTYLFACPKRGDITNNLSQMRVEMTDPYDIVTTIEEYEGLDDKYKFDALVVLNVSGSPDFLRHILNDQTNNSKKVKWVHSLAVGLDAYSTATDFINAEHIPLTNAKGAYSSVLGEFIALGMLYHAKKVESFMKKKADSNYEKEHVQLISNKTLAIVGYGDIGYHCAKMAKMGFGTRVIGLKRRPKEVSDEHRQYCDEIVGMD